MNFFNNLNKKALHRKINERQAYLIEQYLHSIFFSVIELDSNIMDTLIKFDKVVPKNQRYGGHRNTCYHTKFN